MRTFIVAFLSLAALSCHSDGFLGPGDAILGKWGGAGVGMLASPTEVTVSFACSGVYIDRPVKVRSDGSFSAQGVHGGWWVPRVSVSVEGRVLPANIIELRLGPPLSTSHVLLRNVEPDFGGLVCLASG